MNRTRVGSANIQTDIMTILRCIYSLSSKVHTVFFLRHVRGPGPDSKLPRLQRVLVLQRQHDHGGREAEGEPTMRRHERRRRGGGTPPIPRLSVRLFSARLGLLVRRRRGRRSVGGRGARRRRRAVAVGRHPGHRPERDQRAAHQEVSVTFGSFFRHNVPDVTQRKSFRAYATTSSKC